MLMNLMVKHFGHHFNFNFFTIFHEFLLFLTYDVNLLSQGSNADWTDLAGELQIYMLSRYIQQRWTLQRSREVRKLRKQRENLSKSKTASLFMLLFTPHSQPLLFSCFFLPSGQDLECACHLRSQSHRSKSFSALWICSARFKSFIRSLSSRINRNSIDYHRIEIEYLFLFFLRFCS